jgi:hypothetical protein
MQQILDFVPRLLGLKVATLAFLGSLMVFATALQAFLLLLSKLFPVASGPARALGVIAADIAQLAGYVQRFISWLSNLGGGGGVGPIAKGAIIAVCLLLLNGCGAVSPKTAVDVAEQIARGLCLLHRSKEIGVSVDDVEKGACLAADLDPFRSQVLAAQRVGAERPQ